MALRADPVTGDLILYDRAAGTEVPWMSLSRPVGETFPTSVNLCPTVGEIVSRDQTVAVPAGDFSNEIQVKFKASCVDAGSVTQYCAPNVGLVRDEQTSFGGPLIYNLIYYREGTISDATPALSFTLAIDSPRYSNGAVLGARMTLRNSTLEPVSVHFPSGQTVDLQLLNENGDIVFTWSRDKSFIAVAHDETIGPGEVSYGLTAVLEGLPAGHYVAQGSLTSYPQKFLGQISFDIVEPAVKQYR